MKITFRHIIQWLCLLLSCSCLPLPLRGQANGPGIRLGFNNSPTSLDYRVGLPHRSSSMVFSLGHTRWLAPYDDTALWERGALTLGGRYQPRWVVGSRKQGAGFYANLGARLRYHLGLVQRNQGEFTMNSTQGYTLTPDLLAGGGTFVRIGPWLEPFLEVNFLLKSDRGRRFGPALESALGVNILL